jgi:ERF superfamily
MGQQTLARVEDRKPLATEATLSEATTLIVMLDRAVRDPSVDIDKMERLFEMQLRASALQAERSFNASMAAVQAKMQPIAKKLYNEQTKSYYADLAAIDEKLTPIMTEHGFALTMGEMISPKPEHVGLRCTLMHADGHSRDYEFHLPPDNAGMQGKVNKTPMHSLASSITYGRRYAKCAIFNVTVKNDEDGNRALAPAQSTIPQQRPKTPVRDIVDAQTGEVFPGDLIGPSQLVTLEKMAVAANFGIPEICRAVGIAKIGDLTVKQFEACMKKLALRLELHRAAEFGHGN